jgi:hypothetical protein
MFLKIDGTAALLLGLAIVGAVALLQFPDATMGLINTMISTVQSGITASMDALTNALP